MMEYRRVRPEEMDACIAMANLAFHEESFRTLIPKAYAPGAENRAVHYAAFESNVPVALVAGFINRVHIGKESLKYAYIGTVCVHPDARRSGHMRKLMQMLLEEIKCQGCDMAMLNGRRQRYEYFGFSPAGNSVHYQISDSCRVHALKDAPQGCFAFVPFCEEFTAPALALHRRSVVYAERTAKDFQHCLETYRRKAWAILKDGQFVGFCNSNESMEDLQDLVLTEDDELRNVLAAWMDAHAPKGIQVTVPCYDLSSNRILSEFAESSSASSPFQMAVYNFPRVLAVLLELKRDLFGISDGCMDLRIDGIGFTLKAEGGCVSAISNDLVEAPDQGALEAVTALLSGSAPYFPNHAPAGWLPLPISLPVSDFF